MHDWLVRYIMIYYPCCHGLHSAHAVADPVLHAGAEVQCGEAHQAARQDQYSIHQLHHL